MQMPAHVHARQYVKARASSHAPESALRKVLNRIDEENKKDTRLVKVRAYASITTVGGLVWAPAHMRMQDGTVKELLTGVRRGHAL